MKKEKKKEGRNFSLETFFFAKLPIFCGSGYFFVHSAQAKRHATTDEHKNSSKK